MKLTLAERFLLTRHRMGLNQSELARLLRVNRRTIYRIENSEGPVMKATVERFEILEARQKAKDREKGRGAGLGSGTVKVPV